MNYIILHHTAVSYNKNPDQFEAVNNYHRKKWNSKSSLGFYVGYNYMISKSGKVRQARKIGEMGIHCKGHNHDSVGVAMDLNGDIQMPTKAQETSLRGLIAEIVSNYPNIEITTHRRFASYKSCPGKLISDEWIKQLKTKKMQYIINEKNEQYLLLDELKIALNIGDEEELKELQKRGLPIQPTSVNNSKLDEYLIYPLVRRNRWIEVIKKVKDLSGI